MEPDHIKHDVCPLCSGSGSITYGPEYDKDCADLASRSTPNARLMAAAPELLKSLQCILAAHLNRGALGVALDKAQAAIAKALPPTPTEKERHV